MADYPYGPGPFPRNGPRRRHAWNHFHDHNDSDHHLAEENSPLRRAFELVCEQVSQLIAIFQALFNICVTVYASLRYGVECIFAPIFLILNAFISIARLVCLWLLFCAVVHFMDWYLDRHGSLAMEFFGLLHPSYLYYMGAPPIVLLVVNVVLDLCKPLGTIWTTVVPIALDRGLERVGAAIVG